MAQTVVLGDLLGMTSYPAMWEYGIIIKPLDIIRIRIPIQQLAFQWKVRFPFVFFQPAPRVSDGTLTLFDDPGGSEPKK